MAETTSFLLTTPKDIRMRIMREAGLYRECPIRISQERHRFSSRIFTPAWHSTWPCPELHSQRHGALDTFCGHPRLPVALLRVCQQFYREGANILYGENEFIIGCLQASAIQAIKDLSQRSKSILRKLHIFFGNPDYSHGALDMEYDRTIDADSADFHTALHRLQGLCDLFSCHIRPGQLDLKISFSVSSIEGGLVILRSLHRTPPLSQVSFCTKIEGLNRLNSRWQGLLRQHARELIHRSQNRFPFERLPNEIQFMILHHVATTKSPIVFDRLSPHHRSITMAAAVNVKEEIPLGKFVNAL